MGAEKGTVEIGNNTCDNGKYISIPKHEGEPLNKACSFEYDKQNNEQENNKSEKKNEDSEETLVEKAGNIISNLIEKSGFIPEDNYELKILEKQVPSVGADYNDN